MRYRKLDPNGDYSFGAGNADFYQNAPDGVAQAVKTRLMFWEGEWFLNTNEGTPYQSRILGKNTNTIYDSAIKERILNTAGVRSILQYNSGVDSSLRKLAVSVIIDTIYGVTELQGVIL